ncbi:MAG: transporter substrate-binding domain-containing protein [Oscillospiraceae bacterium]|nr:transporter substrate-binding domain-containing protein [Oscillospiraceae bacterium]
MKRILALILVAALCLGLLAGCGKDEMGSYTVLEKIGTKQYACIYRSNDLISDVVEACISGLAASGSLSRLSAKWLGSDFIEVEGNTAALSEVEIPDERVLIIGVDTDAPPFAFMNGEILEGFSVDIANAIGSYLGWNIKIIPVKSADISTQLSSGNIDCALCFAPECVDATKYEIGQVLMESDIVIAVPEGSNVKNIRRIRGERIGTISDPALEKAISEHDKISKHSDGATVYVTPPRCISAMEKGWCVAIVMDVLMLEAYAARSYNYFE